MAAATIASPAPAPLLDAEHHHHHQADLTVATAVATEQTAITNTTPIQADLEHKNRAYAETFPNRHLSTVPARHYAIVTCMDSRIDNFAAFGVTLGDAHIIRNAGGNAHDAFRSLVISQHMLKTKEIVLIKHTGCGMQMFRDEQACQKVLGNVSESKGPDAAAVAAEQLRDVNWGCFPDVVQSVIEDVQWLRSQSALEGVVSGWVYDVDTGLVSRVDV